MQPLILLHAAVGSKAQLASLASRLENDFDIHLLDLPGHGGRNIEATDFSFHVFSKDVVDYMEREKIANASIFGYSMGGYVGLYTAIHFPEKISKLICFATKFHWDKTIAEKEIKMLDPVKIEEKIPDFARLLKERHTPQDWKKLLEYTSRLLISNGNEPAINSTDYALINIPVLLMSGDSDKMIPAEETIDMYRKLPGASLAILPKTIHPIEQADIELLAFFIRRFLQ
ncbi:MAG: alpha/beta fold hydrolase [Ferruginibacter sp.]